MNRIGVAHIGYRGVAILIWATAALAGTSALEAGRDAAGQATYLRPAIVCAALMFIGWETFSLRNMGVPSRNEIVHWLILFLSVASLFVLDLVYRMLVQ